VASSSAVPSLEPSSAITMRSGTSVCPSRAARVTGSTAASLCEATITPSVLRRRLASMGEAEDGRKASRRRRGRSRNIGSVIQPTNSSSTVSYST
jgi:hypothetical protein